MNKNLKPYFYKLQTPYYKLFYFKLLFPGSLDGGDEFLGRSRDFIGRLAAACEGTAGTDGDAPALIESPAFSTLTPPVGMSGACGRGPWMALMAFMPRISPGKILTTSAPYSRAVRRR